MLRKIQQEDLKNILNWRNQQHVRKAMFTDHFISEEEHFTWWKTISSDDSQEWYIFLWNNIEAGVVNFMDIDKKEGSWGFYFTDKLQRGKQLLNAWAAMEEESIGHAFKRYKMDTLKAKVFKFNASVIKMHRKYGFRVVNSELRNKNGVEEEVIIMHLHRDKWLSSSNLEGND